MLFIRLFMATFLFSLTGLYCCVVQNLRGGSIPITKVSRGSIVCVEHSERLMLSMAPVYIPRTQVIRKDWNIYSSILGKSSGRCHRCVCLWNVDTHVGANMCFDV